MKAIHDVIRPGFFGDFGPSADRRRIEFDIKNTAAVCSETPVDLVLAGDSIVHFWDEDIYFRSRGVVLNRPADFWPMSSNCIPVFACS